MKSCVQISKIKGYIVGMNDEGRNFLSIYNQDNKKLFILKENYYSHIPEFIEMMKVEKIGIDITLCK